MTLTILAAVIYSLGYFMLFATWAAIVYLKVQNADAIVGYIIGALGMLTGHLLTVLSPASQAAADRAKGGQGGFAALPTMALAALAALVVCACAAPGASQEQAIRNACAIDAGLRPSVTALLAIPGLATPEEVAGVVAARAIIDPICANPAASLQDNAVATVTSASAAMVGIVAQTQMRKAGGK